MGAVFVSAEVAFESDQARGARAVSLRRNMECRPGEPLPAGFSGWMALLRLREDGQTLVEYSLIMTLVALVVISALTAFGAAVLPLITAIVPAL